MVFKKSLQSNKFTTYISKKIDKKMQLNINCELFGYINLNN